MKRPTGIYLACSAILMLLLVVFCFGLRHEMLWNLYDYFDPRPKQIVRFLVKAAYEGDVSKVRKLLEEEPTALNRLTESRSLLMIAAETENYDLVEFLLASGADVQVTNSGGMTALHFAALNSSPITISLLLRAGADRCAKNQSGMTPADCSKSARRDAKITSMLHCP